MKQWLRLKGYVMRSDLRHWRPADERTPGKLSGESCSNG